MEYLMYLPYDMRSLSLFIYYVYLQKFASKKLLYSLNLYTLFLDARFTTAGR